MKLAFTKGHSILSKFIIWLSGDPISHFVIIFDNKIVFHSNLKGVHLEWLENFKESSDIVYTLNYDLTLEQEELIYQNIMKKYRKGNYDFLAFFYFIFRGLLFKFINIPMPKDNKFNLDYAYLCTELAGCTKPIILKENMDLSLKRPFELYRLLKNENKA